MLLLLARQKETVHASGIRSAYTFVRGLLGCSSLILGEFKFRFEQIYDAKNLRGLLVGTMRIDNEKNPSYQNECLTRSFIIGKQSGITRALKIISEPSWLSSVPGMFLERLQAVRMILTNFLFLA